MIIVKQQTTFDKNGVVYRNNIIINKIAVEDFAADLTRSIVSILQCMNVRSRKSLNILHNSSLSLEIRNVRATCIYSNYYSTNILCVVFASEQQHLSLVTILVNPMLHWEWSGLLHPFVFPPSRDSCYLLFPLCPRTICYTFCHSRIK